MLLCVRTSGLPADLLRLGSRNVVKHADIAPVAAVVTALAVHGRGN
jgi:hypothetical protein